MYYIELRCIFWMQKFDIAHKFWATNFESDNGLTEHTDNGESFSRRLEMGFSNEFRGLAIAVILNDGTKLKINALYLPNSTSEIWCYRLRSFPMNIH